MKVNFVIAGAQKAGTTALAAFLAEHPEICMAPQKEVHLFDAPDYVDSTAFCDERYRQAFPNYHGQPLVGEATPIYMYLPVCVARIQRYNPAMRLIVLLRHPAERALSHHAMERSRQAEPWPLLAALAAEPFRLWRAAGSLEWSSAVRTHSYLDRGFYSRQIANLLEHFPREQLLVLRTEELLAHHAETLRRVYTFLGAEEPAVLPASRQVRPGAELGADEARPTRPAAVASALKWIYRSELARLEKLLGWRLDSWK